MKVTMKLKPLLGFAVSCMIGLSMMGLNSKVLAEEAGENCPENPAKSGTITFSGQSTAVLVGSGGARGFSLWQMVRRFRLEPAVTRAARWELALRISMVKFMDWTM